MMSFKYFLTIIFVLIILTSIIMFKFNKACADDISCTPTPSPQTILPTSILFCTPTLSLQPTLQLSPAILQPTPIAGSSATPTSQPGVTSTPMPNPAVTSQSQNIAVPISAPDTGRAQ